jgi:hypothetical protein
LATRTREILTLAEPSPSSRIHVYGRAVAADAAPGTQVPIGRYI